MSASDIQVKAGTTATHLFNSGCRLFRMLLWNWRWIILNGSIQLHVSMSKSDKLNRTRFCPHAFFSRAGYSETSTKRCVVCILCTHSDHSQVMQGPRIQASRFVVATAGIPLKVVSSSNLSILDQKTFVRTMCSCKCSPGCQPPGFRATSRRILGLFHCHPAVYDGEKEKLLTKALWSKSDPIRLSADRK
ncbi:hypothetical protein BDR03DRAFT_101527 [Suillus americanus]|nr:hypothetical protein BDR03DRAFT_101527 [Suillus americanus]